MINEGVFTSGAFLPGVTLRDPGGEEGHFRIHSSSSFRSLTHYRCDTFSLYFTFPRSCGRTGRFRCRLAIDSLFESSGTTLAGRASERQLVERASERCPFILGASSAGERSAYHACDDGGVAAPGCTCWDKRFKAQLKERAHESQMEL